MRSITDKFDGGYHGLDQRTRRAQNLEKYPLTLGIPTRTVRNVSLFAAASVGLVFGIVKSHSESPHSSLDQPLDVTREQVVTILSELK